MTRWTESDVRHLMARAVGPSGKVGHEQHITALVQRKAPRYTAKRVKFDGLWFGSARELRRYKELKLMELAGSICSLKVHPRYDLHVLGQRLGYIEADFEYVDCASEGSLVVEDVKDPKVNSSTRTAIYRWKAKHLRAEHGIDVTEVT